MPVESSSRPPVAALAPHLTVFPPSPLANLPIEFVGSFPDPLVELVPAQPEFIFLGRSNVGKSSLLNALTGRRGFARVSTTPGKTSLLNVFRLPGLYLIDLPGYGWAKASKSVREGYRHLLEAVLAQRTSVTGVVWLLDIRHEPSAEDLDHHELLAGRGVPVLVVLTKADKLSRQQVLERQRRISLGLGMDIDQVQPTSTTTGLGIAELGRTMLAAAGRKEKQR
jgi:GTP-binding protein